MYNQALGVLPRACVMFDGVVVERLRHKCRFQSYLYEHRNQRCSGGQNHILDRRESLPSTAQIRNKWTRNRQTELKGIKINMKNYFFDYDSGNYANRISDNLESITKAIWWWDCPIILLWTWIRAIPVLSHQENNDDDNWIILNTRSRFACSLFLPTIFWN